ncbi:NADH-quinone oxidoreductase subunit C [Streptomyces sp. NPDC051162]|uniref:NADH-quinone oxidoreductase subunit C n=1 Tax=unclassified Streptomyces TaxID=2593676 RepID=UPI003437E466
MSEPTNPDERHPASADDGAAQDEAAGAAPQDEAPEPAAEAAAPPVGWLPRGADELFGEGASAEEAYGLLTVDVPAAAWLTALETARTTLGCTFFDWLSAVDEPGTGFRICAHLVALPGPDGGVRRLVLRTTVPHDEPALPTATGVYAGAAWHERETHEMFGVDFTGHPHLVPLLLPENFEGHPLRKDFVLAARVAKAWPGAKEPGESEGGGPKRRQMLPPGVPDPNEWGPLKGQLPPAPARPARGARAAGAPAAGDRPVRRTRGVSDPTTEPAPPTERPARRSRSVSEGSASQQAGAEEMPPAADGSASRPAARRSRSVSEGSASQQAAESAPAVDRPARRSRSAADGSASQGAAPRAQSTAPQSSDAPWHHARPAFEDDKTPPAPAEPAPPAAAEPVPPAVAEPAAAQPAAADTPDTPDQPAGQERPADGPETAAGARPETTEGGDARE